MLVYVLAIAVGLSSLILFLTAFSSSDIHQKDDFLWSGVGLFYALVLWLCASRITGSILLGQVAAVTLVISLNWQNLKLRKALANPEQQVGTENFSITELISGVFNRSDQPESESTITEKPEKKTTGLTLAETVKSLEEQIKEKVADTPETEAKVIESENINVETLEFSLNEETTAQPDSLSEEIISEQEEKDSPFEQPFNFDNQQSSSASDSSDDISFTTEIEQETSIPVIESTNATTETEVNTTAEFFPDLLEHREQETITPEEQITVPTFEFDQESTETQEYEPNESTDIDFVDEVISVKDTTELEISVPITETESETTSEFDLGSQLEDMQIEGEDREITSTESEIISEFDLGSQLEDIQVEVEDREIIDVAFASSETEQQPSLESSGEEEPRLKPKQSIDDFLAELDQSVDESSEDKNDDQNWRI